MSFTINPRVLSILSLAVVSVAGQWAGAYNTTARSSELLTTPGSKCLIQGFAEVPYTAVYPCTCTGGTVAADCNWVDRRTTYNAVRNADCKCVNAGRMDGETNALKAYTKSKPNAVEKCACDPPKAGKGEPDADGLIVPARECWCRAQGLKKTSGLKQAEPGEAVLEELLVSIEAAAAQKCSTELDNSKYTKAKICDYVNHFKNAEINGDLQANIPSCTVARVTEICKSS
ncbi:hypothetical protein MY3296_004713 [Beauveria thailandica]